MPVKRTEYFNFDTVSVRSGSTTRAESLMDSDDYQRRLDEARGATLHTWGVCGGLRVSATPGQAGLTVQAGTALDAAGRVSVVDPGGFALTDPNLDPGQLLNITPVVVGGDGLLPLGTAGVPEGTYLLTLTWREIVGETRLIRLHAPWLRLVPRAGFGDVGEQVVLAEVTLAADGSVAGLTAGPRRAAGVPVERVELRCAQVSAGPPTAVGQGPAAELRARAGGGADLTVFAADGTARTALSADGATGRVGIGTDSPSAMVEITPRVADVHGLRISTPAPGSGIELENDDSGPAYSMFPGEDGGWHLRNESTETELLVVSEDGALTVTDGLSVGSALSVTDDLSVGGALSVTGGLDVTGRTDMTGDLSAAGKVRVATTESVEAALNVGGGGVHSGGGGGGYSFADRASGDFVTVPQQGERWVWYAFGGSARLWSGQDLLSVGKGGQGNALDVNGRMRCRQGAVDPSAGIWFHQQAPGEDRAFVGMENDTSVGFWGNTGAGFALVMDTGTGMVSCRGGLTVAGETTFGKHFGRRDGEAVLHLFGSSVKDTGNGMLTLQSGGKVIALSGSEDFVGIGTITPQFKLDVNGDLRVSGSIIKGGGGFMIDHPLDPANKYLSHSFVESPEMATFYAGVVDTDERGEATVALPEYFEALNREFRYQLTPVGGLAQAAVIDEIKDNRFTLRTDRPGVKVSWQVTGVRQDAWAEAHRIANEQDKPDNERSFYLHPGEHGQPESAALLAPPEGTHDD
ncbi:hypothetical protein AB0F20_12145 [Streptomyces goshikiensis]|uniref:hypothetical protein n=1 Tax=Streptomyces goshikiensis TaxID=1942 RepID=UPI003400872C